MKKNENKKTTNNKEEEYQVITDRPEWRDWTTIDGLMRRTGIEGNANFIRLLVKEITDNSVDAGEGIGNDGKNKCELGLLKNGNGFYVQDYGEGIPGSDEHIAYIFSVKRDSSSTKGIRLPTRGVLGNGLRYVTGVVTIFKGTELRVFTKGRTLRLEPQKEDGTTRFERIGDYNGPGTRIEITFKKDIFKPKMLDWGKKVIEMDGGEYYQGKSSLFWYDSESFYEMLQTTHTTQHKGDTVRSIITRVFQKFSKRDLDEKTKKLFKRKANSLNEEESNYLLFTLRKKIEERKKKQEGEWCGINIKRLGCVDKLSDYKYHKGISGTYKSKESILPYTLEVWGKLSKETTLEVFVNRSPIVGYTHCYEKSNKTIVIFGCGIDIDPLTTNKKSKKRNTEAKPEVEAKPVKFESDMDFRVNVITPYIPKKSDAKEPDLEPFNDKLNELIAEIVKEANRDIRKEEHENSIPVGDLRGVIDEKMIKQAYDKAKELSDKIKGQSGVELSEKSAMEWSNNDPFKIYFTDDSIKKAAWFTQCWKKLGCDDKYKEAVHLRWMYYQMISQKEDNEFKYLKRVKQVEVFRGSHTCSDHLEKTSKFARILGMVDPACITDKRNPPILPHDTGEQAKPEIEIIPGELRLPTIDVSSLETKLELPNYQLTGYEYKKFLQPVHIVIFCEKSTMDDIILPLREKYGFTYVPSSGHSSLTHEAEIVKMIKKENKPCVILYISDFDPSGEDMPPSVSKNIEALLYGEGIKNDRRVILKKIALTEEQVAFYDLPESPDVGKKRMPEFEKDHHGHKPVELDALEAIHPGELKKIIEENILKYYDTELEDRIAKTMEQTKQNIDNLVKEKMEGHRKDLEPSKREINSIVAKYADWAKVKNHELTSELVPYTKKIRALSNSAINSMNKIKSRTKLPTLENLIKKPNLPSKDDPTILFDSQRSHLEQLGYYPVSNDKKAKGKRSNLILYTD
jgi:hypothetical protein